MPMGEVPAMVHTELGQRFVKRLGGRCSERGVVGRREKRSEALGQRGGEFLFNRFDIRHETSNRTHTRPIPGVPHG
jgi:hypothetical protein